MKSFFLYLCSCLFTSCAIVGLGNYEYPCDKLVRKMKQDNRILVVEGQGQVITTDYSNWDTRNGSVGESAMYERAKSNMLQKLYQSHSKVDIKQLEESRIKKGKTTYKATTQEKVRIKSKKMVTVFCGNQVYGFANKEDFK